MNGPFIAKNAMNGPFIALYRGVGRRWHGCWDVLNGALRTLNVSNASFRTSAARPAKTL